MKIVIIEDEPLSKKLLINLLEELLPESQIVASLQSVEESIEWFENHTHPNLLFLDVQLSDGNAFDFLKKVSPDCFVIFTTSSQDYALQVLQAYSAFTIDYLLKPICREKLKSAIEKYRHLSNILNRNRIGLFVENKNYRKRFLINKGRFCNGLKFLDRN